MKSKHTKKLRILVACEESQAVTKALRKRKHDAFSCDLLPSSGGHPEWHFKCDVFEVIDNRGGILENGEKFFTEKWDIMIAHPPCTYLAVSGARWFYNKEDKHKPMHERTLDEKRVQLREEAVNFFLRLAAVNSIEKIAIENPIGIMSSRYQPPTQIIQPFMFGDEARKTTCLWLKELPKLKPTKIVGEGERVYFKSGKSQPKWYSDALVKAKTAEERRTLRSKTFKGIANAMAKQWTKS
jgi:site-specific DNA-cytosine methylase